MNKNIIYGMLFIIIPIIVMISYTGYYYQMQTVTATAVYDVAPGGGGKSYSGIVIDHPPKDFLHPTAQIMVGFGVCISSICWGAAKLIKAFRGK